MLTALVLFTLAAPPEPPKAKELPAEAKKELKKLEGKWEIVKTVDADKESEEKSEIYLVFKDTEVTMSFKDKKETIHITAIDATTDPKCIDFVELLRDKSERTLEGIYKIDGDTLQLALAIPKDGKNRPTGFGKPTDKRTMVWTLKRVKE